MQLAEDQKNSNPFEVFYQSPVYLEFKNHLYNYRLRRSEIRKQLLKLKAPGPILEIGSGISTMADTSFGRPVIFSDLSIEGVSFLKQKGIAKHALVMSITDIAFKDRSAGAIVCSEVLEHVKDDSRALDEMARILRPGGSLILTVPAHLWYFSFDDHFVKHERRYAVAPFLEEIRKEGFEDLQLVKVTGFLDKLAMLVLTLVYSMFGAKDKSLSDSSAGNFIFKGLLPVYKILNWIFGKIVNLEAKVMPLATTAVILVHARRKVD